MEPGFFPTELTSLKWVPPHPAYLTSPLPSAWRAAWDSLVAPGNLVQDTKKAVEAFYRVAAIPDPPLHLVLGKDAIEGTTTELAGLGNDIARYKSWSDDIERTSGEGSGRKTT